MHNVWLILIWGLSCLLFYYYILIPTYYVYYIPYTICLWLCYTIYVYNNIDITVLFIILSYSHNINYVTYVHCILYYISLRELKLHGWDTDIETYYCKCMYKYVGIIRIMYLLYLVVWSFICSCICVNCLA